VPAGDRPVAFRPVPEPPPGDGALRRHFRLTERAPGEAGREPLERFVAAAFERAHGARVQAFMPSLLGLEDWSGTLRCALGLRGAGPERLFLEQYLDRPIEEAIAAGAGLLRPVDRGSIVEVGNLAGRGCRAAVYLVAQLPRFLVHRGYTWVTFTATERVRELLAAFDAPLLDLGPADPARLAAGADDWGAYYRTRPRVMAGWLPDGLKGAA
jgi:Thermostable hemolysin